MVKNSKIDNDEINLTELIYSLWEGKWKVTVAVIISLIAVISYQSIKINNFTAITQIKPIGDLELNKFFEFNNLITNINNNNINNNNNNNTNTNTDTDTIGTNEVDNDTGTHSNHWHGASIDSSWNADESGMHKKNLKFRLTDDEY